ncbi:hypothetical protein JCM3774_002980 [Rhodotorula dairenensis]
MELARQQSHMDRLTQTQNSIDDLVRIMYSSLSYLSRKAQFKQINPNFPVTQSIPGADSPDTYQENRKELVGDFLRKAKQLEYLISVLPSAAPPAAAEDGSSPNGDELEFARLEEQVQVANQEYLEALEQAETLHSRLQASLHGVLESCTAKQSEPSDA